VDFSFGGLLVDFPAFDCPPTTLIWVHGKRRIAEPDRTLSALEVEARVCAVLGCSPEVHLSVSEKVT
jgi:hypothetical protein